MRIGFIGLGNVGGKLAGSLLRNGHYVAVRDLNPALVAEFVERGATAADSPAALANMVDIVITCLPSPAASAAVAEGTDGFLAQLRPGQVWMEMSTTDYAEVLRVHWSRRAVACSWNARFRVAATAQRPAISRFLPAVRAKALIAYCRC